MNKNPNFLVHFATKIKDHSVIYIIDKKGLNNLSNNKNLPFANKISNRIKNEEFEAKTGEILDLQYNDKEYKNVYLIGTECKKNDSSHSVKYQKIGGKIAVYFANKKDKEIIISDEFLSKIEGDELYDISLGIGQRNYKFSKYITDQERRKSLPKLEKVLIKTTKNNEKKLHTVQNLINAIYVVKNLINEPANVVYPESFAKIIKEEFVTNSNVKVTIFGKKELEKINAGGILAVGQGSTKESKMVVIEYLGNKKSKNFDLGLVGKGVTFDSGGLSLKPSNSMEGMHGDMGGAATVFGAIKLAIDNKIEKNIVSVVGLVENMPDGNSFKINDIITTMSGKTIEILNTDAEGRVVLADAIYYTSKEFKPKKLIDLATLTGAAVVALGEDLSAIFSNDDKFADKIIEIGKQTGDFGWRLPLVDSYGKSMQSKVADVRNTSGGERKAGTITAAMFLENFTNEHKSWAHIDIAGTSDTIKPTDFSDIGATGWGIKMLSELINNL